MRRHSNNDNIRTNYGIKVLLIESPQAPQTSPCGTHGSTPSALTITAFGLTQRSTIVFLARNEALRGVPCVATCHLTLVYALIHNRKLLKAVLKIFNSFKLALRIMVKMGVNVLMSH